MRLSTHLTVVFACIVAVAAIPFQLEYDDGTKLPTHLKKAVVDVNKQIPKMQQSLNDAAAGDQAAIERVQLAFGPQAVNLIPQISANIGRIDAGTMTVSTMPAKQVDEKWGTQINAVAPFDNRGSANDPLTLYPVELGTAFNVATPKGKNNAAVILHEASHVFFHASDDHYTTGTNDMVPLGLKLKGKKAEKVNLRGGYAGENPVIGSTRDPITEDSLRTKFKELRDSATNMHMNADSYALFGAVCDEQMARRRKRALIEDDPVAYILAKRSANSCKLPPDYFQKKAASRAAKENAASPSNPASNTGLANAAITPASKAGLAKAKTKNAAGVGPVSQKTVKGANPAAASKVSTKPLGKATKSTLQKTSKSSLSKGSLKGSNPKVPTTRIPKASTRGKFSNSKPPKPSSKALSPKRGVPGVAKKGSGPRVTQTKKSPTRSPTSRGKQTSKQPSKLSRLKLSKTKSPKVTSSLRKAVAAPPKVVRKKASTPARKATKASAAPKKEAKTLPTSAAAPPKKKGGKR